MNLNFCSLSFKTKNKTKTNCYSFPTFLQKTAANALTKSTEKIPIKKVQIEERRKHHHFLLSRHSSSLSEDISYVSALVLSVNTVEESMFGIFLIVWRPHQEVDLTLSDLEVDLICFSLQSSLVNETACRYFLISSRARFQSKMVWDYLQQKIISRIQQNYQFLDSNY